MIITDNARTQIGNKWTTTCRQLFIKQRKFVPYNQNQNKVERRVQDVKHKTSNLLYQSGAPLEFWCYAITFVIDCLNHLAKKPLQWRTSQEILYGDTPDISMFRFKFWQPIEFYNPAARFPGSRWSLGRFLGIAWDSGDPFTFIIWSEPNGNWKDGREFTRNIVRDRGDTKQIEPTDTSELKFKRYYRTRKRKGRNRLPVYELRTVPELSGDDINEDVPDESGDGVVTDLHNSDTSSSFHPPPESTDEFNQPMDSEEVEGGITTTEHNAAESTTTKQHNKSKNSEMKANMVINDPAMDIESMTELNNEYSRLDEIPTIGGSIIQEIVAHDWRLGSLELKVKYSSGDTSWEKLRDLQADHPRMVAQYIVLNRVSRSKRGGDRILSWANKVIRDMNRSMRRITRLYDFYFDDHDNLCKTRRTVKRKKKWVPLSVQKTKYGIVVPRTVEQARELDKLNGNTLWQEAIDKEMGALIKMECFQFKHAGFNPGDGWQKTTLHIIFDVKQDLRRKARLVAGGHLLDLLDTPTYSSNVKGISVRILHVIAHKANLRQLCGDISNAFPYAETNEKVFIPKAGPEFGDNEGKAIIISKALYGLCSSSERFHTHLANTLRSFDFKPTRFDNDVWIRRHNSSKTYEYVCTHVDDFMIVSRTPEEVMKQIESVYEVKDSSKGPPEYYLGNDYKCDRRGRWCIGCKKYLDEAIRRIEVIVGDLPKKDTPMIDGDHPEEDTSPVMDDDNHKKYQMLIGMLNWIVVLGRIDIGYATASLSRFTACPRDGHMKRVLRVFGYLKKNKNHRIIVDSRDPILIGGKDSLEKDFTKIFEDSYPDASEEIDVKLPIPLIDEIEITGFVDSDHAHDRITRRSITGLLILIGRTPGLFMSKRQGAIETSTYGAEFCAMRTAVEEVQSVRYMLRCLGVKVSYASLICGDNLGVIQNSTISDSLLKKKHVAIAYHRTREAAAAGMIHPIKINSEHNFADLLTKSQGGKLFWKLYGKLTRS